MSELQSFQREITYRKNRDRVGCIEEVLVEGASKNDPSTLTGRTSHNRIVNFPGRGEIAGQLVMLKIIEGLPNSIRGELSV